MRHRMLLTWGLIAILCVASIEGWGQEDAMGIDRLVIEVAAGAALPFGTYAGRFKEDDPGTRPVLGSAGSGFGFTGRLSYWFHPRIAAGVVYMRTIHDASPTYYDDSPVGRSGHGYIAPSVTSKATTVDGDWITSLFLVEGMFLARTKDPSLTVRGGAGYQNVSTGSFHYEEAGTQWMVAGPMAGTEGSFTSSLAQPEMRSTGTVCEVGLALAHRLGRKVRIHASIDVLFGQVRFKGTQTYRFDGATQSDPDYHYTISTEVDRPNGTTRLLMQVGVAVGLFGKEPSPKP